MAAQPSPLEWQPGLDSTSNRNAVASSSSHTIRNNAQSNSAAYAQSSVPSLLAQRSHERPSLPRPQFNPAPSVNFTDLQTQLRKWQEGRSHFNTDRTPNLNLLYQQLIASQNGTMSVSVPPQDHNRTTPGRNLEAIFWTTVSKLPVEQQNLIFKELLEGSDQAYTNARILNGQAALGQRSPSAASPSNVRHSAPVAPVVTCPTTAAPRHLAPRPTPSKRADSSTFRDIIPANFSAHPRFVPFQVTEYSNRWTDKCKSFLQVESGSSTTSNRSSHTDTNQDPMSKFKKSEDIRSAEEMLRPFASGLGRLVGGLVGADLLDREGSAIHEAIYSLARKQQSAEARAARAEEKIALMERQIHVLQGLFMSNNVDFNAQPSASVEGFVSLHDQVQDLYKHQKDLESRINEMQKQSLSAEGIQPVNVQSAPAQRNAMEVVMVQQVPDANQEEEVIKSLQTLHDRSRSHSRPRLVDGQTQENDSPRLQAIATEQENISDETNKILCEQLPIVNSSFNLTAVKGEEEPDELFSDREGNIPLTSQSPPEKANSPFENNNKNKWYRRLGLGRSEGPATDPLKSSTNLKRKRSILQSPAISIDSSDDDN